MRQVVTLADKAAAFNFRVDQLVRGTFSPGGTFIPHTRWQNLLSAFDRAWLRATWLWRPRHRVARIDYLTGTVSIVEQRWSWTKWRWL